MQNDDMIRKVAGLLAKAEGTDNEAEASAFFEKAQELMVKYAIEEAQLREAQIARDGRKVESPVVVDFMYATNDSHAKGRSALLRAVGRANHVRVVEYHQSPWNSRTFAQRNGVEANRWAQWCKLVGYAPDIERLKVQLASLTIQWARFVRQDALDAGLRNGEGYAYKTGHLVGFASRVGTRLRELEERIVTAASANALMVNKDAEVDATYRAMTGRIDYCMERQPVETFAPRQREPKYCIQERGHASEHTYTYTPSKSNARGRSVDYAGYHAGRSAAERADIGLTQVKNRERVTSGR